MSKPFWLPLTVAIGTIILLYIIGSWTNLNALAFKFSFSYTEISLLPIFIGILFGFIVERILKLKSQK